MTAVAALGGCASSGDELPPTNPFKEGVDERRLGRATAEQLYRAARNALDSSDYPTALQYYRRLDASFPFSKEATQGQLEAIYARFRNFDGEQATAAADRFLRAHPRHPNIDYILYLRGLIHFETNASDILDLFDVDSTQRDPVSARRAFEEFSRLLQAYPQSAYAPDARLRMIWLRERIASHYFNIANYYRQRGACVAAVRRGLEVLEDFRETQFLLPTLDLLSDCYTELGLEQQAAAMRTLIVANSGIEFEAAPMPGDADASPPSAAQ